MNTKPEPLSDERLEEIRRLVPDHYTAPWTATLAADDRWIVRYTTDNPLAGLVAEVPDYGFDLAAFIADARTVMPELLAEVDRLRAQVPSRDDQFAAWLKAQRDVTVDWTAWGALNRALDDYRLHADTRTPLGEHCCEGGTVDDCYGCYQAAKAGEQR